MTDMTAWPLVEAHIPAYLEQVTGIRAGTQIPAGLNTLQGFNRVQRGPGSDDLLTDSATVDVETFAATEVDAARLAETTRQAMHRLVGGQYAGGLLVDRVRTVSSPLFVHYSDSVARYVATYRVEYRKNY